MEEMMIFNTSTSGVEPQYEGIAYCLIQEGMSAYTSTSSEQEVDRVGLGGQLKQEPKHL